MKGLGRIQHRYDFSFVLWSGVGTFIGIYTIALVNVYMSIDNTDALFLIGSFGASAVLIFAAPHAEFSQPRNFLGGHVVSALVGISVYKYVNYDLALLSALSVALSVLIMHLGRILHPPGGATALVAIVGSEQTHQLGFYFAFTPILLDSLVMLVMALLFNNLSNNTKRHYPLYWR